MTKKLWHWAGSHDESRPMYYLPMHVSLLAEEASVRVVLYYSESEDCTLYTSQQMESLIYSFNSLPASCVDRLKAAVDGSFIDQSLAGQHIRIHSIFNVRRDAGFFGSGESDEPVVVAFPLDMTSGYTLSPINVLVESFLSKRPSNMTKVGLNQQWPVLMAVPYPGAPFSEASFVVRNDAAYVLSSNIAGWETITAPPPNGSIVGTLPTIALSASSVDVDADSEVEIDLQIIDQDGSMDARGSHRIYLEETGGFLPLRRVSTAQGHGSFRISTRGMRAGDVFKVKAGFRNYTGCDEVEVRVI